MTFLETEAFNGRYREQEAILFFRDHKLYIETKERLVCAPAIPFLKCIRKIRKMP